MSQKGPYSPIIIQSPQPVAQEVVKSIAQLAAQPVAAPAPVTKPVVAPVTKPVVAPVTKPAVAPVTKPAVAPVKKVEWTFNNLFNMPNRTSNIDPSKVKPWTFAHLFNHKKQQPVQPSVKPLSEKVSKFESEPFSETTVFSFNLLYHTLMFILWVLVALALTNFIMKSSKNKYKEQKYKYVKQVIPQVDYL